MKVSNFACSSCSNRGSKHRSTCTKVDLLYPHYNFFWVILKFQLKNLVWGVQTWANTIWTGDVALWTVPVHRRIAPVPPRRLPLSVRNPCRSVAQLRPSSRPRAARAEIHLGTRSLVRGRPASVLAGPRPPSPPAPHLLSRPLSPLSSLALRRSSPTPHCLARL
jgi:hypothetical protein